MKSPFSADILYGHDRGWIRNNYGVLTETRLTAIRVPSHASYLV